MNKPDLEALVTSRISEALQSAIDKIGREEFERIAEMNEQSLASLLTEREGYVPVAIVTLACQINKSHGDPDPAHSSVTECLKGSTLRMPTSRLVTQPSPPSNQGRRRILNLYSDSRVSRREGGKSFRVLGFSVNTFTFLLLGYLLGGLLASPLLGQPTCLGIGLNPPSLVPCSGSIVGLILGAIGGLGYTYYYFVKKL